MIRDVLGKLWRRRRPAPEPAVVPAQPGAPGPVGAEALAWWRQQGVVVACIDTRPLHELRYGFVEGAILLPPSRMDLVPGGVAVFVGPQPGRYATSDLGPWIRAGYPIREPEWKAPLPLLHPVSTAEGARGWVQDVAWGGDGFTYAVLTEGGRRLTGLSEEALVSEGPRGAAGLGRQL